MPALHLGLRPRLHSPAITTVTLAALKALYKKEAPIEVENGNHGNLIT